MPLDALKKKYIVSKDVPTETPVAKGLDALKAKYGGAPSVSSTKKVDLDSLEGLKQKAEQSGLEKEAEKIVNPKKKLSYLQRLSTGLDVFNPAEAILTGKEKGTVEGVKKYVTGLGKGAASVVTGTDYVGEKRHFADVAEELGIENKIAKAGIGFLGDVLLDPSTYFGGAIARGLTTGAKGLTKAGLKAVGTVAPDVEKGLTLAGTGLQDALGRAFEYGYKATKGAKEDVLTFLSKKQKAQLGLASSNLDRLGTGILNKEQREELALKMVAGKRAEFAAKEAGKTQEEIAQLTKQAMETTDPVVKKTIEEQIARSKKMAEDIGLENPYEVYFPFIKNDKVQKFLNETKGIKIGSEGYKKQFKNILTNENIELDPAKAFFTRESQIVSDKMTKNFLSNFVKKYGKELNAFENSDEAAKAGYKIIKEKGLFGKELGYIPEFDAKLLRDSISPEFQTINMLGKATGFDAITNLFKRSVTGLFAPFHVRNFVSGLFQNFETLGAEALNPKNIAIGQKIAYYLGKGKKIPGGMVELGGKKMKFSSIMKPFTDRFSGDTFYNNDFEQALKAGTQLKSMTGVLSKESLKETAKTAGLGQEAIPFKIGRAIGQFIEHQQKATTYVTALSQGKSIQDALKLAEAAGFDYRALTSFESQIMRRLIPFYSFTRKNLELQLKTLGENPERINQILKFFSGVSDSDSLSEEEKKMLPDYIQEQIAVSYGKNKLGQPLVAAGFGTPVEQPGSVIGKTSKETVRKIATMLNPIIKAPLEKAFGKDFFQNRPIKEIIDAKQYKILPDFIKDFIGFKEVPKDILKKNAQGKLVKTGTKTTYTADPEKLHILRNLPTSRLFNYLYEIYRPEEETVPKAKAINLLTGVKFTPQDLETINYFKEKNKKDELEQLLLRAGVLKEFKNVYVPKKK